jgi:hypothetical protein
MKQLSTRPQSYRNAVLLVGLLTAACSEPPAPENPPSVAMASQGANAIASVGDQLGRLRAATAHFQDFDATTQPGGTYDTQLTGCMTDPTLGGMGFHYGKGSAIDGNVNTLEPEALLYEPQKNGKYKLVAVEFLVPYTIVSRDSKPPRAFDQDFIPNDVFQLWTLHAWVWKNNPAGMFASWNPNVNCDAAPAEAREAHSGH